MAEKERGNKGERIVGNIKGGRECIYAAYMASHYIYVYTSELCI